MVCYAIVNISPSLTDNLNVDQIKTQVANPDFMAVLAPQWPEPDPDPTEDQAFLQQQVRSINLLPFRSQSCRKYNFLFAEAWTG